MADTKAPAAAQYEATAPGGAFLVVNSTHWHLRPGDRVPAGVAPEQIKHLLESGLVAEVTA